MTEHASNRIRQENKFRFEATADSRFFHPNQLDFHNLDSLRARLFSVLMFISQLDCETQKRDLEKQIPKKKRNQELRSLDLKNLESRGSGTFPNLGDSVTIREIFQKSRFRD